MAVRPMGQGKPCGVRHRLDKGAPAGEHFLALIANQRSQREDLQLSGGLLERELRAAPANALAVAGATLRGLGGKNTRPT